MRTLIVAFLLLACPACGDEPQAPRSPDRRIPALEEIPFEARVAYALDRIFTGPERQQALLVKDLHPLNLQLALRDLLDMRRETLAALADSALIARATGGEIGTNPWHAILTVLHALPDVPADLVLQWTQPALEQTDASLRRRAVRVLASTPDPSVSPLLLQFLERDADDVESAQMAYRTLVFHGAPWNERATTVALVRGIPRLWSRAPQDIAAADPGGTPELASVLSWTAALMEGSGPRPKTGLPPEQTFAYTEARLWLDADVPTVEVVGADERRYRIIAAGPLSPSVAESAGWFKGPLDAHAAAPPLAWMYTGKGPAAEVRCLLALWGYAPYVKSRDSDRRVWSDGADDVLHLTARHCTELSGEANARRANLADLERLLDAYADDPETTLDPAELTVLVEGLPSATDADTRRVLVRCLRELRPLKTFGRVLIAAHEGLRVLLPEVRVSILTEFLESADPADRGTALHLMRQARLPEYLPLVERLFESADARSQQELWRLLVFMYSGSVGVEPAKFLDFVDRFERRLVDVMIPRDGAERASRLANGLLDFGDPGAEAYARLLRTDEGVAFIVPLGTLIGVLPHAVVDALVDVAASTEDDQVVRAILAIAYKRFPASKAPLLASLRFDLAPRHRAALDVALQRVRNRGPREATGL